MLQDRVFALDLTYDRMCDLFLDWGFKAVNARQVFTGIQRHAFQDYSELDAQYLPDRLIERLLEKGALPIDPIDAVDAVPSEDGATKYVFGLVRGGQVEAVYMPFEKRNTLCISTQVGCAMGCAFCATGKSGFRRHLSPGEIVSQVRHMRRHHPDEKGRTTRFNVVMMGMGEPLHNFDQVIQAFDILTHPFGLVLSQRDVAVSTAGLIPEIRRLGQLDRRPQLMVSLGATTSAQRTELMPINQAHPLDELLACLEAYPLRKGERIMLSYVLIDKVNDAPADIERLAHMAHRFPSVVNLIPMNAHADSGPWGPPDEEAIMDFYQALLDRGVFVTIRRSRGADVSGACGQLAQTLRAPKS